MPESHLRAGDTDREAVAAALGTHMAAGRLTLAEYDERLAQAYAARTFGELAELTADLPALTPWRAARPDPTRALPRRRGRRRRAAAPSRGCGVPRRCSRGHGQGKGPSTPGGPG